jgi:hypothetical protein
MLSHARQLPGPASQLGSAGSNAVPGPQDPRFSVAAGPRVAAASGPQVAAARREELRQCGHAIALSRYSNASASVSLRSKKASGFQLKCVRARGDMRSRLLLPLSLRMPQRYKGCHRRVETSKAY